jgi:diguanylate cyclase (GGDEF)-like protein
MNPRAEGITGWTQIEATGKRLSDVFVVSRDDTGDWQLSSRNGGKVPVEHSTSPLGEDNGRKLGTVLVFRDISERKAAEDRLKHDALHDALTGLPNRALFMDRLERACERGRRKPDYLFAVLFLDVDRFKVINDSLGHATGDGILIAMAERLGEALRSTDTVARFGGDEFVILLDELEDQSAVHHVVERIHEVLARPFHVGNHELCLTASIGVVFNTRPNGVTDEAEAPEDLLRDADTAMYRAKAAGRARYEIFDAGMHAAAVSLQELERDLHRAVARKELRLVYQPIVDLHTGELAGFEALCRWRHPERGDVSPLEFIPVAEENGQIAVIGSWVIGEALRQRRVWQGRLPRNFKIAINLSSRQFGRADIVEAIAAQLAEQGSDGSGLALEITESAILSNAPSVQDTLARLRKLGLQIHIDDFGTGYSSLSYLHRFPIDMLKIDATFVRAVGEGRVESQIVWTIVNLARSLRLRVVAEGVETQAQLDYLRQLDCHYAQGYLFSRPLEVADATALLVGEQRLAG